MPHSSVGSMPDLRTGLWFNPWLGQYSFRGFDNNHCSRIHYSLKAVHCFYHVYVGKQPWAWKDHCAEYWLKELQESMDRCIGILLKIGVKHHTSIKSFIISSVSARMRPCGIPANKLGFPHISKHGTPDLALKNHIWPSKIDWLVYDRAKVQNCMGRNCIAYEN